MADFLNTGISGLLAFQTALSTTGHNISNVNTPGYNRQRAELTTRLPQPTSAGFIGNGVSVTSVQRLYDLFATQQVRSHTAQNAYLSAYYDLASQVDNLLADPDAGLSPALQSFFDAAQGLADNPSSTPARQVFISEANSLVERFEAINNRTVALRDSTNSRLQSLTAQINTLSDSIAEINYNIVISSSKANGEAPNDLLDQRDELLRQLSELVPVTTVEQDDGSLNVFIGNGQTLVLGIEAEGVSTTRNPYNPYRIEIAAGTDGTGPIISDFISGGEIGGVLQFRRDVLEPTQNALGRVAFGLAESMNEQHQMGLDLNNALGKQFFDLEGLVGNPKTALPASGNAGGAAVTFTVIDASVLTTSDYTLSTSNGADYSLTRLSDGVVVGTFGPLVPADYPFTYTAASEGIELTIDSAAAATDSFRLEPTRTAAADISVLISNVKDLAAAAPLRGQQGGSNLGGGTITNPDVTSATNLPVILAAVDVTLEFDPNAGGAGIPGFIVSGGIAGTLLYDPATQSSGVNYDLGSDVVPPSPDYDGVTFTFSGVPLDGDTFTIGKNNNATSDNRNALKLAELQDAPLLESGTSNLQTAYGQVVSSVGARTHQLDVNSRAEKTILDQAIQTREAISGVNLDEEAANLIRFQQAYQAAAQVISIADSLFQSLMDAVRR